ncbi:IS66 family transposase, partial [Pseudodonghicola xiamenensis]
INRSKISLSMLIRGSPLRAVTTSAHKIQDSPLTLFLTDGRIDLDTNPVERQFKPIILQRKGSLFIGSEEGGQTWAAMSSLVETCKLNRVDTYRYFSWMIDDLAEMRTNNLDGDIDYSRYLPWNAPAHCKVKLLPVK